MYSVTMHVLILLNFKFVIDPYYRIIHHGSYDNMKYEAFITEFVYSNVHDVLNPMKIILQTMKKMQIPFFNEARYVSNNI